MEIADVITPGHEHAFTVGDRHTATTLDELPAEHRRLLEEAVTCALATTGPSGRPQLTPAWCNLDEYGRINVNSTLGRRKDRNLRARPQATLLLMDPVDPYHWMSIYGDVDEIIDEDDPDRGHEATENIDALSQSYLGQTPYPLRDPAGGEVRALYKIIPTRIVTFGATS